MLDKIILVYNIKGCEEKGIRKLEFMAKIQFFRSEERISVCIKYLVSSLLDSFLSRFFSIFLGLLVFHILTNKFKSNTGCPTKQDSTKSIWKSSLILEFIWHIRLSIFLYSSWNNHHRILPVWVVQNVVCLSCALNISGDIENFVQISI